MKIKVGRLRTLIKEVLTEVWGDEKFDVGDWVKLADGTVSQILKFEEKEYKGQSYWLVTIRTVDGTRQQRVDVMLRGAKRASPEEIQQTKSKWKSERKKYIDTSREGT
jgi:hypothetical protein